MNILKEWERDPPSELMMSIPALWYDFKKRREDPYSPVCRFRDNIPDVCADLPTADQAIRYAIRSKRPNGKMHNHQSKVSKALPAYEEVCVRHLMPLQTSESFGSLYFLLNHIRTPGIGPMTVYDVAVRFGAWAELKPEKIYLHAGTKAGLKALGIMPKSYEETIPMEMLPPILRRKDPDEVEDFLCTYRLAFELLS